MTESISTGGVGPALRALRLAADMTLEQVAEAAGVSPSYLSRAENNRVTPTAGWVQLVAVAIGDRLASAA
ncbi:helix-turn-helix domain-containing protein [Nocardioides panaciterrulae]|uniref:Transcriptional regulator with XRE-family HTH domain n=1 Tax=Nocardioides panaciterrulae TaxID=661492 RepID=A0A7Y9J9A3_9ACTN|nr:helix-turn-helix transcriptional regulator [Nocardioides panaciterrulae]NYD39951.1 transcriptional regulator with XRE-family HTH domain [Nocardioides panaciterrulae]NYD43983.1 transcriptional regulator with XRE-family HTH domain [Nocardioides panaciterrulae]